jgi:hypothetical protein
MLSSDDRDWLEEKFTRLHVRIDGVESKVDRKGSDIHRLDLAMAEHAGEPCPDVVAHEDKYHNPAKTWGIIGAMVGVLTGVVELGKWLFKRGGP